MKHEQKIFALGFFDGVHLGHQALLKACVDLAGELGVEAAAITFESHPQSLFAEKTPPLINSLQDRYRLLRRCGISHICSLPVTKEVMSTNWRSFLDDLVARGAAGFVCGDDFRFGSRGEGSSEKLQAYCADRNMPCLIIPEQSLADTRVSSSYIRRQIEEGDMATAVAFLGHPHILTGRVEHGHKLGRKLGFPTANLRLPAGLAVPKFGVYVCLALVNGRTYPAVTNVGVRPTVSGEGITVESWILDYSGDLYEQEITLEFYRFLRSEMKFPDLTALQEQIQADAREVREYFNIM